MSSKAEQKRLERMYKQKQFFRTIYKPLIEAGGNIKAGEYLRVYKTKGDFQKVKFFNDIDDLVKFTSENIYNVHTYFTLATTNGKDGKEENLVTRTVLGFDFDKKTEEAGFSHIDIINRFKAAGLWYHVLVDSGHGYHAYLCIKPTKDICKVAAVTESIRELIGADPNAAQSTQLLRVPYTFNVKEKDAVKPVNIIKSYDAESIKPYDINILYKRFCCNIKDTNVKDTTDRVTRFTLNNVNVPPCVAEILTKGSPEGTRYNDLLNIVVILRERNKSLSEIKAICREWASKSNYNDRLEYRVESIFNNKKYASMNCNDCKHLTECYNRVESDFNYPDDFNLIEMTESHTRHLQAPKREGARVMQANDLLVYGILKNHSDGLFRDEIIKDMTYRGECRLSKNVLSEALNNLEENEFITVETIDKKKFYKIIDIRSKVELTYSISYAATYEAVKGNISAEELKLYNYMRYLHNKQQREDSKALKGNLFQFNQVDLAKDLGLTQGRISQMINNLLEEKLLSIWYRQPSQNNGFDFYVYRLNY